eukprot:IDg3855t1
MTDAAYLDPEKFELIASTTVSIPAGPAFPKTISVLRDPDELQCVLQVRSLLDRGEGSGPSSGPSTSTGSSFVLASRFVGTF